MLGTRSRIYMARAEESLPPDKPRTCLTSFEPLVSVMAAPLSRHWGRWSVAGRGRRVGSAHRRGRVFAQLVPAHSPRGSRRLAATALAGRSMNAVLFRLDR